MRHVDQSPSWLIAICLILFLFAYGLLGRWDYEDARMFECASAEKNWDGKTDKCVKEEK